MQLIKVKMIDANENEATIKNLYFNNEDVVKKGDVVATIETTKATEDIIAEENGKIRYFCKEDQKLNINELICVIYQNKDEINEIRNNLSSKKVVKSNKEVKATKKAMELAKMNNVHLEDIKKDGLIKEKDVKKYLNRNENEFFFYKGPFAYDKERVLIIASGMGAGVVYDILSYENDKIVVGLVGEKREDRLVPDLPILSKNIEEFYKEIDSYLYDTIIISTASNLDFREKLFNKFFERGIKFTNAVHKTAIISKECKIGFGNVIGAYVILGYGTIIGNNNWIANQVNLDHHNYLGSHSLIGPGSKTSGDVYVGNKVTIGTGVFMENYVRIKDKSKVGSGNILTYKTILEPGYIMKTKI